VTRVVLDAGAFIAYERGRPDVVASMLAAQRNEVGLRTPAAVLAQVWRGGSGSQTHLSRLLRGVEVVALDEQLARDAGVLLARSGTGDPIDATVALIAGGGDTILTSDPEDIARLVGIVGTPVGVARC
jgi:predicted nucleic acid-binding protein